MGRNVLIEFRRDTAANWTSTNPTLASGEPGFETDTGKVKIGDGSTAWTSLPYVGTGTASPLTTKGDVWGYSSTNARIPVGTNGQVLTADSTQTLGLKWATSSGFANPMTTEGDIIIENATPSPDRLAIGSAGQVLTVAAGLPSWQAPGSSGTPVDGWINDTADTWTYASGSGGGTATFTIAGVDRTAVLTPGTRIKLTQTTVKYFVVVAASFSTNTTVTITGGSDYTLANATISANYHSYVANPQGYPGWFNFAPAVTGCSGTPTVNYAVFSVVGRTATILMSVQGTSNSTSKGFTSPLTAAHSVRWVVGEAQDNGTLQTTVAWCQIDGTTGVFTKTLANGAWTGSGTWQCVASPTFAI